MSVLAFLILISVLNTNTVYGCHFQGKMCSSLNEEIVRPLVSFSPNWATVLPGDSVNLTCNMAFSASANRTYTWYKDGNVIYKHKQSFETQSASWVDTGHYQCQTDYSAKSDSLGLEVSYDRVIIQVPHRINEGDFLALRCHGQPGFDAQSTIFFKDNEPIQLPVIDSVLDLGKANRNLTGTYKCKGLYNGKMLLSSERFVSVTDSTIRPLILFSPNWTTILVGDSVTLTCNVALTMANKQRYCWYRDDEWIHEKGQNLIILKADMHHSGNYQCQVNAGERSDPVKLDVRDDWLILQALSIIHEGDFLYLRCHSRTGYDTRNTVFYKDSEIIESPLSDSLLQIGSVNVTASGIYCCEKKIFSYLSYYTFNAKRNISVLELFTNPQIKVSPDQVTEGDHMTITCDTKLSPHRETTELQFAFYRNGHNVQGFNSSNQYGVPSAQLEDSGNYTCEVQTLSGNVRKRSDITFIQTQEPFTAPHIKVSLDQVIEGDHVTITCDTKLSPHRATTELQFAFYRNGHNVQGFSLSNQYGVPSAQLEDSGNYTCEVQTPSGSVRKMSDMAHIQMEERSKKYLFRVIPGLLASLLITASILVIKFRCKLAEMRICCRPQQKTASSVSTNENDKNHPIYAVVNKEKKRINIQATNDQNVLDSTPVYMNVSYQVI